MHILLCCVILVGCSRTGRQMKHDQFIASQEAKENQSKVEEKQSPQPLPIDTRIEPEIIPEKTGKDLSLADLYPVLSKAVFTIYNSDDINNYQGSGFFISSSGIAVSNYHVFKGKHKNKTQVVMIDNSQFSVGEVLEKNEEYDYIIFRVNGYSETFPYLNISQYSPKIGEKVFAIGNPKGLQSTLSNGIISGRRDINQGDNAYIQINVEITHGSSGGALFNEYGEVIGITTSGYDEANLNFAVDIQILKLDRFTNN